MRQSTKDRLIALIIATLFLVIWVLFTSRPEIVLAFYFGIVTGLLLWHLNDTWF